MGNNIFVDTKPSPIEGILAFSSETKDNMLNKSHEEIQKETLKYSYQHLNMWCLSEAPILPESSIENSGQHEHENNKIEIKPIEIPNIRKTKFLLDSHNVYLVLLIFKKDSEMEVENSPFPTDIWDVIESSSNMTPRGLLFAFPATHSSHNLESFLLSKRELTNSEFKYMLFIWNGKKSTAFLRSVSLMKAFELDQALTSNYIVHSIYLGYFFSDKDKNLEKYSCVQFKDVVNNKIENSEGSFTPSSDKITSLHETVYLFKLLYPKTNKTLTNKKNKKNKNNKEKKKKEIIKFKGFNSLFLTGEVRSFYDNFTELDDATTNNNSLNNSISSPDINNNTINKQMLNVNGNNINLQNMNNGKIKDDNNSNNDNKINELGGFSTFGNNNNLEKSNLSNSLIKGNNKVMPPKLNLNLNLNANRTGLINSVEDTSNSKSSISGARSWDINQSSKEEILQKGKPSLANLIKSNNNANNKISNQNQDLINQNPNEISKGIFTNSDIIKETNSDLEEKSDENEVNNSIKKIKSENFLNGNKPNIQDGEANQDEEEDDNYQDDDDDNVFVSVPPNVATKDSISKIPPLVSKLKIPKLTVSLQKNVLSDEEITERGKKNSEEEENFSQLPEKTLLNVSSKIIQSINLPKLPLKNDKTKDSQITTNRPVMKNLNIKGINKMDDDGMNNNNQGDEANKNFEKIDVQALNNDFTLKDSERKQIINEYYSKHLSEIIPGFLYLSSYNAAKNKDLLEQHRITHVINCAADFCENVFEKEGKLTYLSYNLKDHCLENIECLFYECISFIESVREMNKRVLVHCIQGMSRSVSIVLAYLIYKEHMTYDKAFEYVQARRGISSPNFGFSIQLQNFYMRLFEPPIKYRYNPKIFAVGSFQNEQPNKIVCRLMNEPFYENKENGLPRMLDKRGVFIIISINNNYIWVGSKIINDEIRELYLKNALDYVNKYLRKYEHISSNEVEIVYEGKENEKFLRDLFKTDEKFTRFKNKLSDIFTDWNNWYKELDTSLNKSDKLIDNLNIKINPANEQNPNPANENKKGFFIYPNENPDSVLDFDDLSDDQFLVACIFQDNKSQIYVWKGKSNDIDKSTVEDYKKKTATIFFKQLDFSEDDINKIDTVYEVPMEESDEFLNLI